MDKLQNLENLLHSGGLKTEPPDRQECEGLMRSAVDRLKDAQTTSLSFSRVGPWRWPQTSNPIHIPVGASVLAMAQ